MPKLEIPSAKVSVSWGCLRKGDADMHPGLIKIAIGLALIIFSQLPIGK